MKMDLERRMLDKDKAYEICSKSLFDCTNELYKTTEAYQSVLQNNVLQGTEIKRIKRQRNYIIFGGVILYSTTILTLLLCR